MPLSVWQTSLLFLVWWDFLLGIDAGFCQMCFWHLLRWSYILCCGFFFFFNLVNYVDFLFLLNQACISVNTVHWPYSSLSHMCVYLFSSMRFYPMYIYVTAPIFKDTEQFYHKDPLCYTFIPSLSLATTNLLSVSIILSF